MWRIAAFLLLATGLFPIWLAVGPFFLAGGIHLGDVLGVGGGTFLIGIIFLFLTSLRRKMPSVAFGLILPLTGLTGYALIKPAVSPFYQSYWQDVGSVLYTGAIWCYLFVLPGTVGAGILHTLALQFIGRRLGFPLDAPTKAAIIGDGPPQI